MTNEYTSKALEIYQKDPNRFFREVLGAEPEIYQENINQTIAHNDRVAISSCHDVGKSWDLARIVLWFGTCFPYSKIITTAPTFNQVKNILWSEIRAAYLRSKYPLGGKMNLTEWRLTKEGDWFALGFTSRNELSGESGESGQGTASSFQGFHAPHILVIYDEATGIPHNIWTMTEGILTSGSVKFVAIGNPTSRSSNFFKCFSDPAWVKIRLSCFDSPNLIANGITDLDKLRDEVNKVRSMPDIEAAMYLRNYKIVKNHLLSLKWVVQMAMPSKWGLEHPLFVSKVLGRFPEDSDGTLISLGVVESAQLRIAYPQSGDRKSIGVDVARFGSDSSVLTGLKGKSYFGRKQFFKNNTTQIIGETINFAREMEGVDIIVVDETGLGGGVVDGLVEAQRDDTLSRNTEVRGVQFGAGVECDGPDHCKHIDCQKAKFVNIKARMFRLLADDLKDSSGLTLPNDISGDIYLDELPTILYSYDSKGRMVIESKDAYKKRTGRGSPDHADSLALANYGRYDEITVGKFSTDYTSGKRWAKPFAASLRDEQKW